MWFLFLFLCDEINTKANHPIYIYTVYMELIYGAELNRVKMHCQFIENGDTFSLGRNIA